MSADNDRRETPGDAKSTTPDAGGRRPDVESPPVRPPAARYAVAIEHVQVAKAFLAFAIASLRFDTDLLSRDILLASDQVDLSNPSGITLRILGHNKLGNDNLSGVELAITNLVRRQAALVDLKQQIAPQAQAAGMTPAAFLKAQGRNDLAAQLESVDVAKQQYADVWKARQAAARAFGGDLDPYSSAYWMRYPEMARPGQFWPQESDSARAADLAELSRLLQNEAVRKKLFGESEPTFARRLQDFYRTGVDPIPAIRENARINEASLNYGALNANAF